jgi:hypothetical protein
MSEATAPIIDVLRAYASWLPAAIGPSTSLASLGIDRLDLPMIVLDIEDRLNLPVCWGEGLEEGVTVGDLICRVEAARAERLERIAQRSAKPRSKLSWISTTAEQRSS